MSPPWRVQDFEGVWNSHDSLTDVGAGLQDVLSWAADAARDDGWPDGMDQVATLLVVDRLVELPRLIDDEEDTVDYGVEQAPELIDALVELLNARPRLRAAVLARVAEGGQP